MVASSLKLKTSAKHQVQFCSLNMVQVAVQRINTQQAAKEKTL